MNAKATGGVLLLVEDDDSIGRLVKSYLEQQDGWRVVWLRTGEEAIAELRRHPVRLVVLDLGLPGIDGFEVCRQIRAQSKVPIVMLTARDEEPDRVAGLELGADDYVPKPFSPRELAARIKAILRRVEQRGEDALLTGRDAQGRRAPGGSDRRAREVGGLRVHEPRSRAPALRAAARTLPSNTGHHVPSRVGPGPPAPRPAGERLRDAQRSRLLLRRGAANPGQVLRAAAAEERDEVAMEALRLRPADRGAGRQPPRRARRRAARAPDCASP